MIPGFDIQRVRPRSTVRGLGNWSLGRIYEDLRKRFTKLALEGGAGGAQRVGPFTIARRATADRPLGPQSGRELAHKVTMSERESAASACASERARWAAVMSSAEAEGRAPLACSLLTDTGLPADKVREILAACPEQSMRRGLPLYERMAAVPRIEIGSGAAATPPDPSSPRAQSALMMAAYAKARGDQP
jgi:hypothetical protein